MREILFRIFDKSQNRMIYSCECEEDLQGKREWIPFMFPIGFSHYDTSDFSEIMLFTGLLDKNGKKIFEGDIVKVVDENGEINELQPDTGIGAIEFLYGSWYISEDVDNGLYDIIRNYSIEVIGNKFDNPELVEVSDVKD